ncbi:hypothetical protein B566_EDAN003823 [Ephemera danica]|nr:hypothetical protein B566_EDAN003823 [Ephemera danica]
MLPIGLQYIMSDEEILELENEILQSTATTSHSSLSGALGELKSSAFYNEAKLMPTSEEQGSSIGASRSKPTGIGGPILVNQRQRGNPLLQHIRRAAWQYEESILADYVPSATTGILFLSLRYHSLNPDYIHDRLKLIAKQYDLRVLLVQVDCPDPHHALKSLTRICLLADMTLMLAWSAEEAGRIVETYKIFESKPPDMIMEKVESDPYSKVVSALTSLRPVNRSDAITLLSTFGPIDKVVKSKLEELELCPGLGPQKAAKLYSSLHQTFLKTSVNKKKDSANTVLSDEQK